MPFNLHLSCFIVHLHLIKLFKSARFKLSHRCLYLGDFFEMVMNTISWAVSCPQMFQARRTLDPNRSCFASLSRFRDGAQAWSSESHPVRAHQAHPTLVRPPLAPNSLRHRGITSKNTFHAGRREAITSRFKLIFPHGRPGFAAMDTLYGRHSSSNFHAGHEGCRCLLCIQYMVTPSPTALGQLIFNMFIPESRQNTLTS